MKTDQSPMVDGLPDAPPAALTSWNPARWLTIFGPGAIVASLTIGTGELIFSSRGGAIFGYRILWLFLSISVLKWVLVFSAARHMVLSGVHPLRRWLDIPIGPRGWLPAVMFLFAAVCIPIWVSFHASVIGDLIADLSGTKHGLAGAGIHLWGMLMLAAVAGLSLTGGYAALERVQLMVVGLMLAVVCVALVLLRPDWLEMVSGMVIPRWLSFPEWMLADQRPLIRQIASQPVWIETSLYVGVIGGAGFDYLAYVAFLREKRWGRAGHTPPATHAGNCSIDKLKLWIRAPLIDCTLSFLIVFVFSAVFVASGHLVLAPQQQIPGDGGFLSHQAQFVTRLHPWLYPLYVGGTLLTMFGTLYGTLEVAPAMFRECYELLESSKRRLTDRALRRWGLAWTAGGGLLILLYSFVAQWQWAQDRPPGLTALLIPANLFTGVLSCGLISLLNPWIDRRLPARLRPGRALIALNLVGGGFFLVLGLRGYWDYGGPAALGILLGTLLVGCLLAWKLRPVLLQSSSESAD